MRFLHTADWQMGMKACHAGEKAKEVRAKRFETVNKIVELAKEEKVDFVIIAGDLFEDHDIDDSTVRKTVGLLDSFAPIPVYVLPGNHDPLIAGGIWDRQSWQRVGNHVILLREKKEIVVSDKVVIYPSPLQQKQSNIDPTEWIPARDEGDNRIRIGIAHGSLDILPESTNFPIASDRAEKKGLDYLALGDWHSFQQQGRTVYAGTMEQTSFTEKDSGNVAIVEITQIGMSPVITKHHLGQLLWTEYQPEIQDRTDIEHLNATITKAGPLTRQLLRITPRLALQATPSIILELSSLRNELLEEAFLLLWPEETLNATINTSVSLPEGLLTNVDSDLALILEQKIPEGPGQEFASYNKTAVQEARLLLRRIAMEAAE